ncbi:MAG: C_GCAxxG_C_C family protein [Candidatus Lokiarchaeota archaeon]|nr:C_GCAxxG_C_C family protein [Candidatus Lokiarchaeota archaeon]
MARVEKAVSCFGDGFSCSQAIISTYGIDFGLGRELALKMATGFGGGMGGLGGTCGAVTGAIMVIGLKYGRTKIEDMDSKEKTYRIVKDYMDNFISINGSTTCNKLLDCDVNTPEGKRHAIENNLFKTLCPDFVRSSAEILEKLL